MKSNIFPSHKISNFTSKFFKNDDQFFFLPVISLPLVLFLLSTISEFDEMYTLFTHNIAPSIARENIWNWIGRDLKLENRLKENDLVQGFRFKSPTKLNKTMYQSIVTSHVHLSSVSITDFVILSMLQELTHGILLSFFFNLSSSAFFL